MNCPMCGGEGQHLGTLGTLDHFRCRACGWTFPDPESAAGEREAEADRADAQWEHENRGPG